MQTSTRERTGGQAEQARAIGATSDNAAEARGVRRAAVLVLAVIGLGAGFVRGAEGPGSGASTRPAASAEAGKWDYLDVTLSNGLRVIALEDFNAPVVQVQVWYHVGSKNEDPERQGFAHMFEHMMFRGTDAVPMGEFDQLLRKIGSDNNAYTFFDQTVYHEKVAANQLDLALFLEADRMAALKIDQNAFSTERKVVEEERRQGLNSPYGTIFERMMREVYKVHPYRWTPIGKIPHLRKASVEELARFWERYYVPDNATLVVVGAVKKEEVARKAEAYFGWIPRGAGGAEARAVTVREPAQAGPKEIRLLEPTGPQPMVWALYRSVPVSSRDLIPLDLAMSVLADGESSRLYRLLVKGKELAVSVESASINLEQDGLTGVQVLVDGSKGKAEDVAGLIEAEFAKLRAEGVTAEELEKAKLNMLKSQVSEAQGVEKRAELLGTYAVLVGDLSRVNTRFAEIRAVTPEDVLRVARQYLVDAGKNLVLVKPVGEGGELMQDAPATPVPGATTAPASAPPVAPIVEEDGPPPAPREGNPNPARQGPKATAVRPPTFPTTAPVAPLLAEVPKPLSFERVLGNGLKVVVVPRRELPLVTMTLGVKAGARSETPGTYGAASMAASLITQGAGEYDGRALAELLERNAISLAAGVDHDATTVGASSLTEQRDLAMRLLAETVLRPTFPETEFEQVRDQTLAGLAVSEQEPKYVAEREISKRLFGAHPYARPAGGTTGDVKALTRDAVAAWWKAQIRPDIAVLYVAGDVEPESAFAAAEKYLGGWTPAGDRPPADAAALPARQPTTIYLVDRPGLVQSEVRIAQTAINRKDPRWGTARVLSQIFGESFTSRLNASLRVEKGLTYGVSGYIRPRKESGSLFIDTFSKTESTAATVRAAIDEVVRMKKDPIEPVELNGARNFLVGSFAGRRETAQDLVSDLWLIESSGLPADFMEATLATAAKSTAPDVLKLAAELFDETKLTVVVVGDAAAVKADLAKIAPVVVVPPEAGGNGATTQP